MRKVIKKIKYHVKQNANISNVVLAKSTIDMITKRIVSCPVIAIFSREGEALRLPERMRAGFPSVRDGSGAHPAAAHTAEARVGAA